MGAARAITVVDDDRIRVSTLTFDETGRHRPGRRQARAGQEAGVPYLGRAGTEHDVVNAGAASAIFVEIELKR